MDESMPSTDRAHGFQKAETILSAFDAQTLTQILEYAADVTLIIEDGLIVDLAVSDPALQKESFAADWIGKSWISTVTVESRSKIEDLLTTPAPNTAITERQVNHMSTSAQDIPINYKTLMTDQPNRVIALGRNLKSLSALQQRLVRAHQDLERDYTRLRATEARYRLLLHSVGEPILVADAETLLIDEINASALRLMGRVREEILGNPVTGFFSPREAGKLQRLAAAAIADGTATTEPLELSDGQTAALSASAYHQGASTQLIIRVHTGADPSRDLKSDELVLAALQDLPDALAVTGPDLRLIAANRAFMNQIQVTGLNQIRGTSLGDFLGRSQTDLNVLVSNLKTGGYVRNFATILTDRFGSEDNVEVSAIETHQTGQTVYGFSIRNVTRRLPSDPEISQRLPSTADQLTNLVGRVPLKDIVKEATVLIERLCIEAALNLTGDNRASAAEILGLSRQGLYSKLNRFGDQDRS